MKRLHLHVSVDNLAESIAFYSALFGAEPGVCKPDYAKWLLDDPRVNFAISARGAKPGLDHLGIQVESDAELEEINTRLAGAALPVDETPELELIAVEELAPWVVLLRWRERTPDAVTLRASVWIKNGETWRLRFEQGTPVA